MKEIEVGKKYEVNHGRKGKFVIRVDKVKGRLVYGTIIEGLARYLSEANRGPGDEIELDTSKSFITLSPVKT